MAGVSTGLARRHGGTAVVPWPVQIRLRAAEARLLLVDILPILAKHWARQRLRDLVDALGFLTATEREDIKRWLRSHGC